MKQHVDSISDLSNHPALHPLSRVMVAFVVVFLGVAVVDTSLGVPFALLVAVIGPGGVVSGIYFDGVHGEEPLPATHVAFLIALLTGVYGLFIATALLDRALTTTTTALRGAVGIGTLIATTAALYWWALRQLDH